MSRYRFHYTTYFVDDSGYSVVTAPHCPISVIASTKKDATDEVFRVFEGAEYKRGWSLMARLDSCDAVAEGGDDE